MTVRIAQLSDTHFLEEGGSAEGGHSYDIDAAFEAVRAHIEGQAPLDLVAVTGDVADHGLVGEYRRAGDALAGLPAPVNVCPGNHDFDAAFFAGMGRPSVGTSRMIEAESWAFLFVDSSAGMMQPGPAGLAVDPPGEERLHNDGKLGEREAEAIRRLCTETSAEHVFVWLHHPPDVPIPMAYDESYAREWHALLADLPNIRGFGCGHTHIPADYEIAGRPVFVAPSLKNNFSLDPQTWLPPGYRTFEFEPDGSISSEVHLMDDERWPRRPYGRALASLFNGELTHAELYAISARKAG